jgi:hypothetical protein
MIFVIKSSSKPYWSFKNKIKLIKKNYINLKIDMFYFNQFLHNFSNLILIRFKGIEANYFYVYQTNFI